ncbi:hypothetical protein ACLOJK_039165, partial [Asimina triloba]
RNGFLVVGVTYSRIFTKSVVVADFPPKLVRFGSAIRAAGCDRIGSLDAVD